MPSPQNRQTISSPSNWIRSPVEPGYSGLGATHPREGRGHSFEVLYLTQGSPVYEVDVDSPALKRFSRSAIGWYYKSAKTARGHLVIAANSKEQGPGARAGLESGLHQRGDEVRDGKLPRQCLQNAVSSARNAAPRGADFMERHLRLHRHAGIMHMGCKLRATTRNSWHPSH